MYVSIHVCTACGKNEVAKEGASSCVVCSAGQVADTSAQECRTPVEKPDEVLLIYIASVTGVCALIYTINKLCYKQAQPGVMGLVALTAVDFFSDVLFAYTTEAEGWLLYLRYASVACLIIPLVTNMVLSLQFIQGLRRHRQGKMMRWLQSHELMAGIMLFAGAFNVELMTLMNSYLFHKENFKAPISEYSTLMLKSLGLYTNVLEVSALFLFFFFFFSLFIFLCFCFHFFVPTISYYRTFLK